MEAGVDFLITQLFLDNTAYFAFVKRVRAAGIDVPIVPGIMPMVSIRNLRRCMQLSPGSKTPRELEDALISAEGNDEAAFRAGVEWATLQCNELLAQGAPGIHFYTLNRSPATLRVRERLSLG